MKTIEEMSIELRVLFDQIKSGVIDLKQATELNNTAGKIISIAKVQLAYHALRGETPRIPFIAGTTPIERRPAAQVMPALDAHPVGRARTRAASTQ